MTKRHSRFCELSDVDARRLVMRAQGLEESAPFGRGKKAVQSAIEHLGYVQIDTISVVARAHHHVLWSRVPDYSPASLHELMARDRSVFEYWSHAASYLPIHDYRFSLPRKKAYAEKKSHWFRKNRKAMRAVLDRIRAEGPLQAKDFEAPAGRKSAGWFDWKPAKIALEQLFMSGELMIRERRGFQKVYDLAERVLPANVNTRFPTATEIARHWIDNALRSQGIVSEAEIRYLRRGYRRELSRALREMQEEGEIQEVKIQGLGGASRYARTSALRDLEARPKAFEPRIHILSPFDNLVIQRKRLLEIFQFNYQIECYLPESKRNFGYFCLPLLYQDPHEIRLIGRIDAKAHRDDGLLSVKRLYFESRGRSSAPELDPRFPPLQDALGRFADFNGCSGFKIESVRRIRSSI